MSKKYTLVGLLAILFCIIGGYIFSSSNKTIEFEDGLCLAYSSWSASEGLGYEFYTSNIDIYSDGRVEIYTSDVSVPYYDEYPSAELFLSDEDMLEFLTLIQDTNVVELPNNMNNGDTGGVSRTIEIFTTDQVFEVGGLNVKDADFNGLLDLIFDKVGDESRSIFSEIEQMQKEGYELKYED